MTGALIYLILLITIGYGISKLFKKNISDCIPVALFGISGILFIFGLFDKISIGVWLLVVVALAVVAMSIYKVARKEPLHFDGNVSSLILFVTLFIVFMICVYGRYAYYIDDFSYWASSVKKMFVLDKLPCVPEAHNAFNEYPPGMGLLQYLMCRLGGEYREWYLQLVYMSYIFALSVPFVNKKFGKKNIIQLVLTGIVIFGASTIIFPKVLDNLQIDCALGVTFAYAMCNIIYKDKDEKIDLFKITTVVLAANMLVLLKTAGTLLAIVVLVSLVIAVVQEKTINKDSIVKPIYLISMVTPVVTYMAWRWKYKSYGVAEAFSDKNVDIVECIKILLGKADGGYRTTILQDYIKFMLENRLSILPLYPVTYIQFAILIIILLCVIGYVLKKHNRICVNIPAVVMMFVGYVLFIFGLLVSYMYTFSEDEGLILAGADRYLNVYHVAFIYVVIFGIFQFGKLIEDKLIITVSLLSIILFTDTRSICNSLLRVDTKISKSSRLPYQSLANQIMDDMVENHGDDLSSDMASVMIIDRFAEAPHYPVNHMSYILYPYCNIEWNVSIGSKKSDEDTFTLDLSSEEFLNYIVDNGIDYLALHQIDEDFIDRYSCLFENAPEGGIVYAFNTNSYMFEMLKCN